MPPGVVACPIFGSNFAHNSFCSYNAWCFLICLSDGMSWREAALAAEKAMAAIEIVLYEIIGYKFLFLFN